MASPTVAETRRRHWLALRKLHGEPITYRAGDLVITKHPTTGEPLKAVPAQVDGEQVALSESTTVTSRGQDWLIDPDELLDALLERVEPEHGHTITRASGEVYAVSPTDNNDDVWRWSDALHTWRRIHSELK
jgi:hypothetical protein